MSGYLLGENLWLQLQGTCAALNVRYALIAINFRSAAKRRDGPSRSKEISLDHPICTGDQSGLNFQSQLLRRLEVDD
jgi:hypothetical protein